MWLSTVKPPVKYEGPPFPALRKQSQRPDQKMRIKTAQWNPLVDSLTAAHYARKIRLPVALVLQGF